MAFVPCLLRKNLGPPVWMFPKMITQPLHRRFARAAAAQGKKSIADELGLPNPPTKPLQPFAKYMSLGHKLFPHLSWTERIRELSEIWHKQTQEERAQRLDEYYQEKNEYQIKYKAYLSRLTPEQIKSIEEAVERRKASKERAATKREKKKEMEMLGRPKHPDNSFFIFLNALRSSNPSSAQGDSKDFLINASSKWKALPEAERKYYREEGQKCLLQYEKDMVAWEEEMVRIGRPELLRKSSPHLTDCPSDSPANEQIASVPNASDATVKSQTKVSSDLEKNLSTESSREPSYQVQHSKQESLMSEMNAIFKANELRRSSDNTVHSNRTNNELRRLSDSPVHSNRTNILRLETSAENFSEDFGVENLELESLSSHMEDGKDLPHEIEAFHLDMQPLNREYIQSLRPLTPFHRQAASFVTDSTMNTD